MGNKHAWNKEVSHKNVGYAPTGMEHNMTWIMNGSEPSSVSGRARAQLSNVRRT